MHILIAGASGFLGRGLTAGLRTAGHQVTTLSRGEAGPETVRWDPYGAALDPRVLDDVDAVVNLAGSPTLGNPHSRRWADNLLNSRVTTTRVLAAAIAAGDRKPAFLAGNGISFYGDRGGEPLPESAGTRGDAFLTQVTIAWQAATEAASSAGARVVVLRTAPVLDRRSAPLKQLRLLFKTGLAGRIGSGEQYFPVISRRDWTAAVIFAAEHESLSGPVNLSCPMAPTNAEFTRELARLVRRPAVIPVPAAILRRAAGRMAPELLGSVRSVPQALLDAGFEFSDRDVAAVLRTGIDHRRRLEG